MRVTPVPLVRPRRTLLGRTVKSKSAVAVLASAALAALPSRAIAQTSDVSIRWSAPPACPDGDSVTRRVVALSGSGVALSADVAVTKSAGTFEAILRVRVGESVGERVLGGSPSCEALAESVAVLLALSRSSGSSSILEPEPAPSEPLPPPMVSSTAPVETTRPATSQGSGASSRASASTVRVGVRVFAIGALDLGTMPGPAFGAGIGVALAPGRHVSVGLTGAVWADQSGVGAGLGNQGARFGLLTADIRGCYALLTARFAPRGLELSPCLDLELARMSAAGFNAALTSNATGVWLSVGASVSGRWELARSFALRVTAGVLVPTVEQSFRIVAEGTVHDVHEVGAIAFRSEFGPEVRF